MGEDCGYFQEIALKELEEQIVKELKTNVKALGTRKRLLGKTWTRLSPEVPFSSKILKRINELLILSYLKVVFFFLNEQNSIFSAKDENLNCSKTKAQNFNLLT